MTNMGDNSSGVEILDGHFTVYRDGTVWSNKTNKPVGAKTNGGYLSVVHNTKKYLNHRLVAHAFLGLDLSSDITVDHINRDKTDNSIDNLQLLTRADNAAKAAKRYSYTISDVVIAMRPSGTLAGASRVLGIPVQ